MKRRESIKTAFTLALVFFLIKFALDILLVFCEPIREMILTAFGSRAFLKETGFSAITKVIYIVTLSVAILPKCILAFLNLGKTDLQKQRGLTTLILTAVFSLLSSIVSAFTTALIPRLTGLEEYAMLSSLSLFRSFTGILSTAATVILYCCGAIEMYNGTEKPAYPPVNGDINNTEDTLY